MEVPAEVQVHNELVGMKGNRATLLFIHADGYYELNVRFPSDKTHRVLLPVNGTVLIATEPEEAAVEKVLEVER